jgi:flavin reductase (DIM6/NTAB) family NADH-FMN oxidoreductase RutF/nitroreductase
MHKEPQATTQIATNGANAQVVPGEPLQDFRNAMRRLAATVCIVTTTDEDDWQGMTATSVTSVSMDPASVLVCVNTTASLHKRLRAGTRFCINVLKSSQGLHAGAFSSKTLKGVERFAPGAWEENDEGLPFLKDAQANLFCTVDQTVPYGTHTIFIGRVSAVHVAEGVSPLIYQDGQYGATTRIPDYPIDALFLQRWSPRAFTAESIPEAELMTIFEAARWAPSCFNSQPWRFLYVRRDTPGWDKFLGLLIEFNQGWARNASALVIIVSNTLMKNPSRASITAATDEWVPSYTHSFDAGAAWAQLGLQAMLSGWRAHAMVGFDMELARTELKVPDHFRIEAAVAIGRQGHKSTLGERLQKHEQPSEREPLSAIALEGGFPLS